MNTSFNPTCPIESDDHQRPIAYVAMQDRAARQQILSVLERAGWAVISQPSGFHLLQAIAGVIDGEQPWLRPGLIVVDARSRGCAGTTIAAGLRDLGITIPIVLIAAPGEALPVSPDRTLRIVDGAAAEATVAELCARIRRPASEDDCPGVSSEELRTLFEPFRRGHTSKAGAGFGLSIARRAVEAQGGTIHAESPGASGCHFLFTLSQS